MTLTPNLRAALLMTLSMAAFVTNDALTKYAAQSVNMGQVMLVRGAFAVPLIWIIAWRRGATGNMRRLANGWVLLRTGMDVLATLCFLLALANVPLVNASAVLQALPLAVTMGAALFLAEPVGWRRWLAILVGFAGVMIVLRPGTAGFNHYSLLLVATVLACAVRDLATRFIPPGIPSLQVSAVTATAVMIMGGFVVAPLGGWQPIEPEATLSLFGAAVLVLIGYQSIILSLRAGDISFSAPFRYTALIWATLLGFLAFGEIPDAPTAAGASLIIASGLFALWRERKRSDATPVAAQSVARTAARGL